MGPSGEFDWTGYVDDPKYGWVFSDNIARMKTVSGQFHMYTSDRVFTSAHDLNCHLSTLTTNIKIMVDSGADFKISMLDEDRNIGSMWWHDGNVYTYDYNQSEWAPITDFGEQFSGTQIITIIEDIPSQTYSIKYGSYTYKYTMNAQLNNFFSHSISMDYNRGEEVSIDYIRTFGSGNEIAAGSSGNLKDNMGGDITILDKCDTAKVKGFREALDGGDATRSYPTIASYCAGVGTYKDWPAGTCSYTELKKVLAYNTACTRQALNYCVDKTYRLKDTGTRATDSSRNQGVTVCATTLGMYTVTDQFAMPMIDVIWEIIWSNPVTIAFVFIFTIIIMGIVSINRRR
jgi:hypothetical protein